MMSISRGLGRRVTEKRGEKRVEVGIRIQKRKYVKNDSFPVYFGVSKKSRSLLDIFSKKEPDLDPKFVAMLRCPISNLPLRYDGLEKELIQDEVGIVYHVVHGIPILTPSSATSLHKFVQSNQPS